QLQEVGGLYFLRLSNAGQAPANDAKLVVNLLAGQHSARQLKVPLRPVGEPGWDQRTWFELPSDGSAPPARVEIHAPGWTKPLVIQSNELGLFHARRRDDGLHAAVVPAGDYLVRRWGTVRYRGESWKLKAESGGTTRLEIPRLGPTLRIEPRFSSGAPVREVGIRVMRGKDIVFRELEPFGCADGPIALPIGGLLAGKVEITVYKMNFETQSHRVLLGDKDVDWTPTLVERGPR
ncbi:MAG: hypothetical protein AAGD14_18180, partial [Planctomycetota bacterium]